MIDAFTELWETARKGSVSGGLLYGDPFYARLWFSIGQAEMAREFAAGQGASLAKLDALVQVIERLAADYATVHALRIDECEQCGGQVDDAGVILHRSGCTGMWPDPVKLHIPGEGL